MTTKKIPLEQATTEQLRDYCETHLGITISHNPQTKAETIIAKIHQARPDIQSIEVEGAEEVTAPGAPPQPANTRAGKPSSRPDAKDPKVTVIINESKERGGKRPIQLGVNGVIQLFARNKRIEIPYRYYEVLKNSMETHYEEDEEAGDVIEHHVPAYPFQTISMPSQDEIDAWMAEQQKSLRLMATFLSLCDGVAKETNNVSGSISTVSGQTGYNADIVRWVQDAWRDIQTEHKTWLFRRIEFSGSLTIDLGQYQESSFSLTTVQDWIGGPAERDAFTIYDASIGVSDEGALRWIPWANFDRMYRRGSQTSQRPINYSIAPNGRLWIGPAPDKAYTIRGLYVRTPQELANDADEPICPAAYHDVIKWDAVERAFEHDEDSVISIGTARSRRSSLKMALERSQLPRASTGGGPLA